jgi:transketolase
MRNRFFELLKAKMHEDNSLFIVAADMGLGLLDSFQREFPDRFLNVGIAEQNMIGVASGLCNVGFSPFCYTISNFLVQRCFEQIRNDVCVHKYPITLVGTSTGFDNGLLGPTHQIIDDIGCMKMLPYMNVYSPATVEATGRVLEEVLLNREPAYVRIGKGSYDLKRAQNGMNYFVKENTDSNVLLVTHGSTLRNCIDAAGIVGDVSIFCMNKIKPFDGTQIRSVLAGYKKIVVVEDHFASCGLYNILCQFVVEAQIQNIEMFSLSPNEEYADIVGDSDFFAEKYGYSSRKISDFIKKQFI